MMTKVSPTFQVSCWWQDEITYETRTNPWDADILLLPRESHQSASPGRWADSLLPTVCTLNN